MYRVRQHSFDEGHVGLAKDQHKVVQITAFSGERYVLDVAGAQFGLLQPLYHGMNTFVTMFLKYKAMKALSWQMTMK